jgi:murein DD-endopeptidase MepM/ murein hydrolase activator NlpD
LRNKPTQAVFKNTSYSSIKHSYKLNKQPIFVIAASVVVLSLLYAFSGATQKENNPTLQAQNIDLNLPIAPLLSYVPEQSKVKEIQWQYVTVKKGQTLSSIFDDMDLSQSLLYKIIHINKEAKKLTKIFPGASIGFVKDATGKFEQLKYKLSETQELFIKQEGEQLLTEVVELPLETTIHSAKGIITGSLFNAGKAAGLTDNMVMQLANIFAWDIDFILDIRSGDNFSLIYEKIEQDGEFIRDGKILAASFTNQGETFTAVAFDDGNGVSYYNPEGRNMKKAFLRAPLNFSYISSNFNPKRFHPVQKRVKAHRGIDYAAPRGTPIYAAGDGKVIRSSYSKYNGNHIFIKHPSGIVTKYLHLTKRYVKKGARVKQGKTIGTLGSTGMVTGPHLHYEFVLNGVHRNPRTVKLPKASPLKKSKMPEFKSYVGPILSQLDSINFDAKNIAQSKIDKTKSS